MLAGSASTRDCCFLRALSASCPTEKPLRRKPNTITSIARLRHGATVPEYILTARRPNGQTATERVDTTSAERAVRTLEERGYTDIVLHTDDVAAHYTRQRQVDEHVSPAEFLQMGRSSRLGLGFIYVGQWYAALWWLVGIAMLTFAYRRWIDWPWGTLDIAAIVLFFLPWFGLIQPWIGSAYAYERFIEAGAWYRWDEVLRLLPTVQGRIPAEEAAFREAAALAGLGRLDEALAVVEPFSNGRRMPRWMYWARLNDVYSAAAMPERCVAVITQAAELAPDNATVLVDLATARLIHQRDLSAVRDLLRQIRTLTLSDVLQIWVVGLEGMLALEEGRVEEAVERLTQARGGFWQIRHASPLVPAVIDRLEGYLALAYAANGQLDVAREHFRRAEPRLRRSPNPDLLRRCEQALG